MLFSRLPPRGLVARCHAAPSMAPLAQPVVIERRSCDVLVLGDSALASAAAYSLARRGRQVIHVPDMGIQASPPAEAIKPLLLLDLDPSMTAMANDSALFFQGMELQASTPLVWPSQSLDLAPSQTPASGLNNTLLVELMDQLAVSARQAGVSVSRTTSENLLTPYPMLRLGTGVAGLMQVHGGVVNASAVGSALQVLGTRSGVMLRDALVLKGWQDHGSYVRVRAASRLQPDVEHVFEAERVLLAPGAWAADCLRLWGLDVRGLEARERHATRCAAGSDLSRVPLIRYWDLPALPDTPPVSAQSSKPRDSSRPADKQGGSQASKLLNTGSESDAGSSSLTPSPRPFLLFPRLASSTACKLTGAPSGSLRVVESCWDVKPVVGSGMAQEPAAVGQADTSGMLEREWQTAADLVKGLSAPVAVDAEEGEQREEGSKSRNKGQVTWDMVTPDGLPLLGWHPAFEAGRVLVAGTVGHPAGSVGLPGTLGQSAGDGYQFTPVLAKSAADMLVGSALASLPMDIGRLTLVRECLQTQLMPVGCLDYWDQLSMAQSGELHAQQVIAKMSEAELQALDEQRVVQAALERRAQPGPPGNTPRLRL